jgi:hypothetical protein
MTSPEHASAPLAEDIERQLVLMADRAPSCRRVLEELRGLVDAESGGELLGRFEKVWQRRSFSAYYERPLLVLAALRDDALVEGRTHPLWRALGRDAPDAAAVTREAVAASVAKERLGFWMSLRTRRVQTNEVRRALVWLWPAALAGCGAGRRALAIVDIGASAGLNLSADGVDVEWTADDGGPIERAAAVNAHARLGFDTRPLDVRKPDDRRWLEACVWPGETDRLELQARAIDAFFAATPSPELSIATASAVPVRLAQLVREAPKNGLVIAYQSMMVGYLTPHEREAYERGMTAWLESAPARRAAWVQLEIGDSTEAERGTRIEVRVATGGGAARFEIGRTGYHPRTVHVDRQAEAAARDALAP